VSDADLDALVALLPFAGHLGLTLDEAGPDRVIARIAWAPHLYTTATMTSTTQLFRPVSAGTVRAVAVPLHRGRTTVTAQTSLYDFEHRLVAQTTQIQAVRQAPQGGTR
jgi:1,4-dihydroxy-2-naphthoyl-CoA hydrolase